MTTSEKFDLEKWAKELCLLVPIVCPDHKGLASVEKSMRNCLIEGFQKAKELYEPQLEVIAEELKENLAKWDKPLLWLHEIHKSIEIVLGEHLIKKD